MFERLLGVINITFLDLGFFGVSAYYLCVALLYIVFICFYYLLMMITARVFPLFLLEK